MSEKIKDDPREVLCLLNSLGFVGITAIQLKAFMKGKCIALLQCFVFFFLFYPFILFIYPIVIIISFFYCYCHKMFMKYFVTKRL